MGEGSGTSSSLPGSAKMKTKKTNLNIIYQLIAEDYAYRSSFFYFKGLGWLCSFLNQPNLYSKKRNW